MSNGIKVLLGVVGGAVLVLVLLPVFAGSGLFGFGPMMGQGGMMGADGVSSELYGCSSRSCSLEVLSRLSSGQ